MIKHMRREPNISSRNLARLLDVTEKTVRLHLRRLHELNVLRVVTMINLPGVGLPFLAAVGVQVRGRAPQDVARDIARIDQVLTVNLVLGKQDLEIQVVTRSLRELADLTANALGKIDGVGRLDLGVAMRVLKHEVVWVPFPTRPGARLNRSSDAIPFSAGDGLDARIVECLAEDSRVSNRAIARRLRVTEGTIRARRRRLMTENIVRTATVMNVTHLHNPLVAYFWIGVDASTNLNDVAAALAALPQITFVALMSGRCDVLAITLIESSEELLTLLHDTLDRIPGIFRTEYTLGRSILKHDSRWCVIAD